MIINDNRSWLGVFASVLECFRDGRGFGGRYGSQPTLDLETSHIALDGPEIISIYPESIRELRKMRLGVFDQVVENSSKADPICVRKWAARCGNTDLPSRGPGN